MKKVLLSLALSMPFLFASAQSSKNIEFGVNGGLSLYNITKGDGDYKAGFAAGVAVNIPVSNNFSIQPEALYQQQGAKASTADDFGNNVKAKVKLGYVNIPVLAKYQFDNTNLSIYAGPQLGILTSAKASSSTTISGVSTSGDVDIKDNLNSIDFSGAYGLEYYFPINAGTKIVLNARYNTGFTNLIKNGNDDGEKSKNTGFTFMVGYRF